MLSNASGVFSPAVLVTALVGSSDAGKTALIEMFLLIKSQMDILIYKRRTQNLWLPKRKTNIS